LEVEKQEAASLKKPKKGGILNFLSRNKLQNQKQLASDPSKPTEKDKTPLREKLEPIYY
jgi:hypothetical protein